MNIKNLSGMNETQVKNELSQRVRDVVQRNELNHYPSWIRDYKNFLWYNGDRYFALKSRKLEWMYNWFSKTDLIKRAHFAYYWLIKRLKLNRPKAESYIGSKYNKYAKMYEHFVKYIVSKQENKAEFEKTASEWLLTWNGFFKIMRKKVSHRIANWVEKMKGKSHISYDIIEEEHPYIKYISCFDAIIDPTGLNRITGDKCYMSDEQIDQFYDINEQKKEEIKNGSKIYKYDYNRVKDIRAFENTLVVKENELSCDCPVTTEKWWFSVEDWVNEVITLFVDIKDKDKEGKEKKTYTTYKAVIINSVLVEREKSDYPFAWSPIVHSKFIEVPWSIMWMGIGELWALAQAKSDIAENTKITAQYINANPMFIKEMEYALNKNNDPQTTFQYEPRSIIEWNDKPNLWFDVLRIIDVNVIPLMTKEKRDIESAFFAMIWLNAYVEWWGGAVEQSSGAANLKASASNNKIGIYVDNLSIALSDIYEKCALMMKAFGTDIEISDEDWEVKKVALKDLYNWYKITFDTEDLLATNEQKRSNLSQILQYADRLAWQDPDREFTRKRIIDEMLELDWIAKMTDEEVIAAKKKQLAHRMELIKAEQELFPPQPPAEKEDKKIVISLKDINEITDPQLKELVIRKYLDVEYTAQSQPVEQQVVETGLPPNIIGWLPTNAM